MKLTIIGGGNLGSAIAEGLLESHFLSANDLTITKRNLEALEKFRQKGANISSDNKAAIENADVIILALKPYQLKEFLQVHAPYFQKDQTLISTATGISLRDINDLTGGKLSVFRAMPNTAISIRQSMTCLASDDSNEANRKLVKEIFEKLGKVIFIEENLMDAATVLAACGTAFAMRYIRANIQGGVEAGFHAETARFIVAQTVGGAAELLLKRNTHPEAEIDKVATPRGCTIAGLNEMEHQGFSSSLIKGIMASLDKIFEMR